MRIKKPKCRVCGAPVEFFGDLCADDQGVEVNQVWLADQRALEGRMAAAEAGDL